MIVALYLIDEEAGNAEMGRLKPAQPPRKEALPTTTIPLNPVPKKRIRKKATEPSPKSVINKPPTIEDIIRQRQRKELRKEPLPTKAIPPNPVPKGRIKKEDCRVIEKGSR